MSGDPSEVSFLNVDSGIFARIGNFFGTKKLTSGHTTEVCGILGIRQSAFGGRKERGSSTHASPSTMMNLRSADRVTRSARRERRSHNARLVGGRSAIEVPHHRGIKRERAFSGGENAGAYIKQERTF